jgi:hypothetical protein
MHCEFERNCLNECNVNAEGAIIAVMAAAGLVNMHRLQDTCARQCHEQNGCDYDYAMSLLHKFSRIQYATKLQILFAIYVCFLLLFGLSLQI